MCEDEHSKPPVSTSRSPNIETIDKKLEENKNKKTPEQIIKQFVTAKIDEDGFHIVFKRYLEVSSLRTAIAEALPFMEQKLDEISRGIPSHLSSIDIIVCMVFLELLMGPKLGEWIRKG